jgi:membrane associated rhomboid family serine protease
MARGKQWQRVFSFGGRLPWAIGLLLSITVALSLLAAFGSRHDTPFFDLVSLRPADVWRGQLWRLLTWPFVEPSPLGLIFACLMLYWFGGALARQWGSQRFLVYLGGVMLVAGAGTCAIARIDRSVLGHSYLGGWAVTTAMSVTWGLSFPYSVVRIYFVLPLRGYWLAWLTVAVTVVLAIYSGWEQFLPELLAEGTALAWLFRKSIFARWSRSRSALDSKRRDAKRRSSARRRGRRVVDYLRAVDGDRKDDDSE